MFHHRLACYLFGCFFSNILWSPAWIVAHEPKKPLTGRELFNRPWEMKDPLCPVGDGLGPCFNDVSCVACHHQGSVGGGGDNDHNVDLLTLQSTADDLKRAANGPRRTPLRVHPDFLDEKATIVLHRFGTYSDYEPYRFTLLGIEYSRDLSPTKRGQFWAAIAKKERQASPVEQITVEGVRFVLTHRNTPALFGAGLIDAIPAETILAIEEQQAAEGGRVSGRVAVAKPSRRDPFVEDQESAEQPLELVGRFGWRGQTATLADFVLGACANELGLQTPEHEQPINPLDPKEKGRGLDLEASDCQKLIQFVKALPRPSQIKPREPKSIALVDRGEVLFHKIGCVNCHVETVGGVNNIYSDLLLHDLGPALSDPVPALPKTISETTQSVGFGYFGGVVKSVNTLTKLAEVQTETRQEWRTPPLWGVADSAPYLHDGRAKNLHQAIAMHGGEATDSRDQFGLLPGSDRESVIAFMMTLRAPLK